MWLWQTHVKNNVLFYLFVENTCRGPYSLIKDLNDKGMMWHFVSAWVDTDVVGVLRSVDMGSF